MGGSIDEAVVALVESEMGTNLRVLEWGISLLNICDI